eukprot:CAMPEP_0194083442 /NCGR_PEP_ID=MMETSP0149-20130528/9310_1 /TAXON_ID=122233 /ORGANISM="Chaetoceros debilis, Strain MM31A-1" /LENGTH=111 /DNA_ID=CAMNT_0038765855 /DNA_START=65 /DNA_END=401 /DNA_ORIENTATION=+
MKLTAFAPASAPSSVSVATAAFASRRAFVTKGAGIATAASACLMLNMNGHSAGANVVHAEDILLDASVAHVEDPMLLDVIVPPVDLIPLDAHVETARAMDHLPPSSSNFTF